ncbi:MAG: ABC transporter permease subunit [Candidatus Competibacterales bacterium]|nr:ABC transporter permease subunit [Candidatus Competibacterales bacterium]
MAAVLPRSAWALRTTSFVVLLGLWQIAAWSLATDMLPSPLAVAARIAWEISHAELPWHLGITLARVAISFALAMLIGTAIGIVMGRWRSADLLLDAWLVIGLNIPALVTIILCYVWIGLTDLAAIVAVAINKIPIVVVTVREGARAVDRELLAVARAFRLSRRRTLLRVYLPQLYPYIMAAARGGLALIWKIVLVVELLGRSDGIGFQLSIFFQFFDITGIVAYTVVFASVVLLVEALLMRPLERRLNAWRL